MLVVGAGGLGCPVGLYLAAAGIGRIGIVDYDTVEVSNLHRQVAHRESRTDQGKAASLAATLRELNSTVRIEEHALLLASNNALSLVQAYDIVVDATDNAVTRYLLNDACVLADRPLVSGAALRLDGQLTVYHYGPDGPCYRCLYPEPPPPEAVTNCDAGGVLGPVPGLIGCLQALEVLKMIALEGPPNYVRRMLLFSGDTGAMRILTLRPRRADCAVCGEQPRITDLAVLDYGHFCRGAQPDDKGGTVHLLAPEERISPPELAALLQAGPGALTLLDVRSAPHSDIFALPHSLAIPLADLPARLAEIPPPGADRPPLICICRRGNDSQHAVRLLQQHGWSAKDVVGGLHAYARSVDPRIPIY